MQLFQHAFEQWETRRLNDRQQLYSLTKELEPLCDAATNLYVVDLQADNPLNFGLDTLVENIDLRGLKNNFGSNPDQNYVKTDIIPYYLSVKETKTPSRLRMKSRIQDQYAVYDRMILPVDENKRTRWAMSITKTRLLLPVDSRSHVLTPHQEDILHLLAQGQSAKETARKMGVSFRTVEHHLEAIKKKLGAKNISHAVAIAVARAILE